MDEYGYGEIGSKFACAACVEDPDLAAFVHAHAVEKQCSYCQKKAETPIAMPVDNLLAEFADAVSLSYRRVGAEDYFDGDIMAHGVPMAELLEFTIGSPFSNTSLEADIVGAFLPDEEWCEASPYNLNHEEALLAGWQSFSEQIRRVTRYLFFTDEHVGIDEVAPGEILKHIHELVDEHGLVSTIERSQFVYRARHTWNLDEHFEDAETLGPPTPELAKGASRMSSAGIPVFYGALDLETAVQETLAHAGAGGSATQVRVCWGTFRTVTSFRLIDLTTLPPVPGFFSPSRANRETIGFLRSFAEDVAKPIPPDGREHSEYAPTQVVAEYFRHVYRSPAGLPADGILYPSSKTEGQAFVLFVGAEQCCDFKDWSGEDTPHKLVLMEEDIASAVYGVRWQAMPTP